MTTFETGRAAEDAAAAYLRAEGYEILEQNWRTRWCEIDIVATKAKTVSFVEVKYRKSDAYGSGLDYITPVKLRQMTFAAEMWVNDHNWMHDYTLAALEVTGPDYVVTQFLSDLS